MNQNFLVRVSCMTYNQAPYIVDAMKGFAMQETNFPFVCTIIDDASTDGEQEVIKNYMQEYFDLQDKSIVRNEETDDYTLIFARHKTNMNCYFAVLFLKYNHYNIKKSKLPYIAEWKDNVKYIAVCEGDDYWVYSKRLQSHVEFLESHPRITYACTRYKILNQSTGDIHLRPNRFFDEKKNKDLDYYEFSRDDAFRGEWITKTLTSMYRRNCYDEEFAKKFKYYRDVHVVYMLLSKGNGVCFNYVSGVYRLNEGSTYGGKEFLEKKRQNYLVYEELYNHTRDRLMLKKAANSYIPLFKSQVISYIFPHNLVQLYAILILWPIMSIKKILSFR